MRYLATALALLTATSLPAQSVPTWSTWLSRPAIELRDAQSISLAADGTLYIADTGHHRIVAVNDSGRVLYETGGFGNGHGQFQWPRKVIADRGAAVWVLDHGNRRIEKFSRTLEYQGTFTITSLDSDTPSQIEAFAVSPQGDLYVFDRDGGRLVRYDPLFRAQAELGPSSGTEFVSSVSQMTYATRLGVVWWERGSTRLRVSDQLFTQVRALDLRADYQTVTLASSDTCAIVVLNDVLRLWCDLQAQPDSLFDLRVVPDLDLKRLDDIAVAADHSLYLLDGLAGVIYRLYLPKR